MAKIKKRFVENKRVVFFNKKDPIFNSWFVVKLINNLMVGGEKNKIETAVFKAFSILKQKYNKNPLLVYFLALQELKPVVGIKSMGFGKKRFIIPLGLPLIKQYKLAIKWLAESIKNRKERKLEQKLVNEIIGILERKPTESLKKRNMVYFQAQRNRHFANYF